MKEWLLAAMCSKPELVTLTLGPNSEWTAPANVGQLVSVASKGQDGTPERDGQWGYTETLTVTIDGQVGQVSVFTYNRQPLPEDAEDYCESPSPGRVECYTYGAFDDREPATNGLPVIGFGKTFPGGIAGPAVALTFQNVLVIPNQSYRPTIPFGTSITISYYI